MKPEFSPQSSNKILKLIYGYQLAHCIHVAVQLDIAELLFEQPRSIDELASSTSTDKEALYRVLKVLAGENIFKENEDKIFEMTNDAMALHKDTPGTIKYYFKAILGEHSHAFENLLYSVQTGKTAFDHYYKQDVWEYYGKHPEDAANFNKAMAGLTEYYASYIVPAYDFEQYDTIVDIGGGNGMLMAAIIKATKAAKGIIFDADFVIPQTEQFIQDFQLTDRCSAVAGDFFKGSIPQGDLYILKYILHDWSDEECMTILKNCAASMKKGSKLLIMESVLPSDNTYNTGRYTDVTMLACTRGKERTRADFESLLSRSGLKLNDVTHLSIDEVALIEGEKE